MAESELFERGLQARREVLGAEYVDKLTTTQGRLTPIPA
jgi:hypothetical protein